MEMLLMATVMGGCALLLTAAILYFLPVTAGAHCDTMDGPTAADGITALETGNINHARKWIQPDHRDEAELKEGFDLAYKVYQQGGDAREVAERYFIDLLVRIHRFGEGAPHVGVKPHGIPLDRKVAAADQCIEDGDLGHLAGLVSDELMPELDRRLRKALSLKHYDINDVPAAREYVEAYVSFFHLAEEDQPVNEHGHEDHGQEQREAHRHHH